MGRRELVKLWARVFTLTRARAAKTARPASYLSVASCNPLGQSLTVGGGGGGDGGDGGGGGEGGLTGLSGGGWHLALWLAGWLADSLVGKLQIRLASAMSGQTVQITVVSPSPSAFGIHYDALGRCETKIWTAPRSQLSDTSTSARGLECLESCEEEEEEGRRRRGEE